MNSRTHSDVQVTQIAASIKEFGFLNPIIVDGSNGVIAGHGRLLAAKKLGMEKVPTVEASHLTEAQKKAYVIADNKLALNAGWDEELLKAELDQLKELNFNISLVGFDISELGKILNDDETNSNNPYTDKIITPKYEPTGEKPKIEELYDDTKAMDLIVSIQDSALNEKEKQFLMSAASRHIVFNYDKIANFYAHASKECQELMEKNALVIIDYNQAIENGFVNLSNKIDELVEYHEDEQ